MKPGIWLCGVCGCEGDPEVIAQMAAFDHQYWVLHNIERKGGVIRIMTCPSCNTLTDDLIFETYRERIREGLVPGFH